MSLTAAIDALLAYVANDSSAPDYHSLSSFDRAVYLAAWRLGLADRLPRGLFSEPPAAVLYCGHTQVMLAHDPAAAGRPDGVIVTAPSWEDDMRRLRFLALQEEAKRRECDVPARQAAVATLDERALTAYLHDPRQRLTQVARLLGCTTRDLAPRRCPKLHQAMQGHRRDAGVSCASTDTTDLVPPPGLTRWQSAAELAARLHRNVAGVESFLRRHRAVCKDCAIKVDNPRPREPRFLYNTAEVWPVLLRRRG